MSELTAESLIAERAKIVAERDNLNRQLKHIDGLLKSRYNWKPDKEEQAEESVFGFPASHYPEGWVEKQKQEAHFALFAPPTYGAGKEETPAAKRKAEIFGGSLSKLFQSVSIQYSKEVEAWYATLKTGSKVTVRDFREWLRQKYGDAVNEASLKGAINSLEDEGKLLEMESGSGRRPSVYFVL